MDPGRLLIVSNRLPIVATTTGGRLRLIPSIGGLATGLRTYLENAPGLWIGWPGDVWRLSHDQQVELVRELRERSIVPVSLSRELVERSYQGFANRVVWPLFHYLVDRVPVDATGWDAYRQANEAFAQVVEREYRRGDTIWVHDYQLMLLPALLRERLPDARIGFFLHVPFPSSEVFRTLPWRKQILAGLLGSDLIGFHTFSYMRHFLASLLHVQGLEADIDRLHVAGRDVKLGVYPMGVDAARFSALADDPEVLARAAAIRRDAGDRQIVLGVDRLDYTKGIPRRLQAVERLLERNPELTDRVRYIQVAVPSREGVDSYQRFKRQVEEVVGRINGARGTVRSTPVHYIHRSIPVQELTALYRAADVMLVTPLRDGMNLVAKEFVAARPDEDGVLVLSEFAGAAAELDGALTVNPYDVDGVAGELRRALSMTSRERRARMKRLRRRVLAHDVHEWARSFLQDLDQVRPPAADVGDAPAAPVDRALARAGATAKLRLLLDYDGTLVPLVRHPDLAAPDHDLLALLTALSATGGTEIDVVSGRPREVLDRWLGHLPVALWAEHGFWHRPRGADQWHAATATPPDWTSRIVPILEQFTASTPGSHVEMKTASVAWHFRRARRDFGARQAHELRMLLGDTLSNQPFEVLEGKRVIEIRLRGVNRAAVAHHVLEDIDDDAMVMAFGDDRTDEDLFDALPPWAVTVAVGDWPRRAMCRVDGTRGVRQFLSALVEARQPVFCREGQRYAEAISAL